MSRLVGMVTVVVDDPRELCIRNEWNQPASDTANGARANHVQNSIALNLLAYESTTAIGLGGCRVKDGDKVTALVAVIGEVP